MKEETIKQPTDRGKSTTIRVSEGTKEILERLMKPNESADDFLFRVLSAFETHNL